MRKPDFCPGENKGAYQVCSTSVFCYMDSTFLPEISRFVCGCIDRFVWDLVRNPEDQFSGITAHMSSIERKPVFGFFDQV